MTDHEVIERAFGALTDSEIANLKWHEAHGTPICCGNDAGFYADGVGL